MSAVGNYVNNILKTAVGLPKKNNQAFYPEDCPLVTAGLIYGHRFHCSDNSSEQIAATLNGIADMIIDINENLLAIGDNLYEEHSSILQQTKAILSTVQKKTKMPSGSKNSVLEENDFMIKLSKDLEELSLGQEQLTTKVAAQARAQINSQTRDILSKVNMANDKLLLANNTTLIELRDTLEKVAQELNQDPNNPKPVELNTERNSLEILNINKKIVPLITSASEAITRSNHILDDTLKVLTQVKNKLGIDENFSGVKKDHRVVCVSFG